MSERDLWEDLRSGGVASLDQVAEVRLERSGKLGVLRASRPPRVVELRVADGVQRIGLGTGLMAQPAPAVGRSAHAAPSASPSATSRLSRH